MKNCFRMPGISILFLIFLFGCAPKHIKFPSPVDTRTKAVSYPEKQIFRIPESGVYARNDFAGARLNDLEKVNDSTIKLVIRPENMPINNSAYYAFKTWSDEPQTIYFEFDYPPAYRHRYIPKLKTKNQDWTAADTADVFLNNGAVTLRMQLSKDTILVAAQELLTSKDVAIWYSELAKKHASVVHVRSAGQSVMGKNIPLLDIFSGDPKGKPIIVLLTRQHPPEVTGHMAFQSFLETVLGSDALSERFLDRYRILAFPIMNPDGVDMGNWRHNAGGVDLNRDWAYYRQPEVRQVVKIIETAAKKDRGKVVLGLDFHSTRYDIYYTNPEREGISLPGFVPKWFAALEAEIPDYKVNEERSLSTRPVSKGWFLERFNAVSVTYEIGDATPRDFIQLKGTVSAKAMMEILLSMFN